MHKAHWIWMVYQKRLSDAQQGQDIAWQCHCVTMSLRDNFIAWQCKRHCPAMSLCYNVIAWQRHWNTMWLRYNFIVWQQVTYVPLHSSGEQHHWDKAQGVCYTQGWTNEAAPKNRRLYREVSHLQVYASPTRKALRSSDLQKNPAFFNQYDPSKTPIAVSSSLVAFSHDWLCSAAL